MAGGVTETIWRLTRQALLLQTDKPLKCLLALMLPSLAKSRK